MISKFIKIKNIGRWRDFSATGKINLDKVNIIYGENSQGKTTLVSILRSLVFNKPELITERKTFGVDDDQYVELLLHESKTSKFQNGKWINCSDNLKNVEIFDEIFINDNIYTGMDILPEHQKGLCGFAIGDEGVAFANEIERIKKDLQSNRYPELENLGSQIKVLIGEHYKLEDFINIHEDREIEKKIIEKKKELDVAEKSDKIREKRDLTELSSLSLPVDFDSLKNLLSKSLTNISEEALKKTTQQINTLANVLEKEAESWLHQGLIYIETTKSNLCPFCQQDLKKAEDTIKVYQQYFNEEYKKFKKDINKQLEQINAFNIEQSLNQIKEDTLTNNVLIEFWREFLTSVEFPELRELDQYNRQIVKLFKNIKLLLENKSKNILESIDTGNIDILSELVKTLHECINSYNSKVKICTDEIKKLKEQQPDIKRLNDEIEKLEIQKKRYTKETEDLCNKYVKCQNDIEDLKKSVEENTDKLKETIIQKVKKYGDETNSVLEKFGVPFKITKPKLAYKGKSKEPYFEYLLEMKGYEIDILKKAKFTLSGGDRNAFALAFFLAKIYIDGNIENKIIIFDDPVSSLDTNRKRRTIEFIRDLSQKARQVIVLTHLNTFAFELYDSIREIGISPKCLQIINGDIKEWDIEEEKKHPFFKNFSKLESFVNNEKELNLDEAKRLIRICLEDKLRFNYFQFFSDLGEKCWLGAMVDKLRKSEDEPELKFKHNNKKEVVKELGNLCDFSGSSHHGTVSTPYKSDYNNTEIINYVKLTLKLIYEWL